jgi:zinc/manganese transport system substrate-binding protein
MLHNDTLPPLILQQKRGSDMNRGIWLAAAAAFAVLAAGTVASAANDKIALVTAENFYGDIAQQIGGDNVAVSSIMSNPDQDPHLFEVSPAVARQIASAQIIVYNGADYDPWMVKLLAASPRAGRVAIVAADLVHKKAGENPHLWYDPATMPAVAGALAAALAKADPAHADDYAARLKTFAASLTPINEKIAALRAKFAGVTVTATEPVYGYMADTLKLKMRNERLQLAIMNDTEPSARDVAGFERDLKTHKVRLLFYNKQASNKLVQHLVDVARASNIPIVGVTETCPPGMTFQEWMQSELDATEHALASPSS